ncbi:MAG TPA: chemotaxis protein CheW [Parvibaculum sp.]
MLFLLMQIGRGRYALETSRVVEILPLLATDEVAGAPRAIAGTFNYRGMFIPAIDMSELVLGRPAARRLSTRIVVVRRPPDSGSPEFVGLIAECATETMRCGEGAFTSDGVRGADADWFGPVANTSSGPLRRVNVDRLLSAAFSRSRSPEDA